MALLFPILKTAMKASGFEAVSSTQQSVEREVKPFSRAIDSLYVRRERCAEAGGAYIEWWVLINIFYIFLCFMASVLERNCYTVIVLPFSSYTMWNVSIRNSSIFWNIAPCILLKVNWSFAGKFRFHLILQKIRTLPNQSCENLKSYITIMKFLFIEYFQSLFIFAHLVCYLMTLQIFWLYSVCKLSSWNSGLQYPQSLSHWVKYI